MIFVTVGTHEQQFNRLIYCIDKLKEQKKIKEKVIIQTGYSTYAPTCCEHSKFLTYKEMLNNVSKARIIISHGGPSSFIMPLQIGKIPIVVPRNKKFDEHINNHQIDFVREVVKRYDNIIPVYNIEKLEEVIVSYENKLSKKKEGILGNNQIFNEKFEKVVKNIM